MSYKKDIIIIHHIPVDGLTRQRADNMIYDYMKAFETGDFYQEYFLPYRDGNPQKVIIETINLKNNIKKRKILKKLNKIENILLKWINPKKYNRLQKLKNILK